MPSLSTQTQTHPVSLKAGDRLAIPLKLAPGQLTVAVDAIDPAGRVALRVDPLYRTHELAQSVQGSYKRVAAGGDGLAKLSLEARMGDALRWMSEGAQNHTIVLKDVALAGDRASFQVVEELLSVRP